MFLASMWTLLAQYGGDGGSGGGSGGGYSAGYWVVVGVIALAVIALAVWGVRWFRARRSAGHLTDSDVNRTSRTA
jgi:hypothetical protein